MQLFTNNAISKLAAPIDADDLMLSVLPGTGNAFPQPINLDDFFYITLEDEFATKQEIVKVIDRIGDIFTIGERGVEGTIARPWSNADFVDHRHTAGTIQKFETNRVPGKTIKGIIPASTTTIVDVYTTTLDKKSCKWIVTIDDTTDNKIVAFEVLALYKDAITTPFFNNYGKIGEHISYTIDVDQNGLDMRLKITNNETHELMINILRLECL